MEAGGWTFAAVALILAAIGIFGVLSYAVSERTREIGIRMALGAQERSVIGLIVRQAMILVAGGVAALADDDQNACQVAKVLVAVALVASYLPARRATRVDPVVALRAE